MAHPRLKQYPPRTGILIPFVHVKQSSHSFTLHKNHKTWSVQSYIIHLVTFGGYNSQYEATAVLWGYYFWSDFFCGLDDMPLDWPYRKLC